MFKRFSHSMQHTIPCRLPPFYNSHANNKYSSQSTKLINISFITAVQIIMWKWRIKTRWSLIHDDFPFGKKNPNILALQSGKFVFAIVPIENLCAATVIGANIAYYSILFQRQWKRRRKYLFECEYVNGKINNKQMRKTHKNMYSDEPSDVADEH